MLYAQLLSQMYFITIYILYQSVLIRMHLHKVFVTDEKNNLSDYPFIEPFISNILKNILSMFMHVFLQLFKSIMFQ